MKKVKIRQDDCLCVAIGDKNDLCAGIVKKGIAVKVKGKTKIVLKTLKSIKI